MDEFDTIEVQARLYAQARRRLLDNEPLRDNAMPQSVAASLSAGQPAAGAKLGPRLVRGVPRSGGRSVCLVDAWRGAGSGVERTRAARAAVSAAPGVASRLGR